MRTPALQTVVIAGPLGRLDTLVLASALDDRPLRGIALVAHPNPIQGGTNTNKVVHTLAKTLSRLGWVSYCPNLRGVGNSEGAHDDGRGEVDDMAAVLEHARGEQGGALPLLLAGFSFGTYVQTQLAQRLGAGAVERLVLVGTAASRWQLPPVSAPTLLIHGEADEVVPLSAVFDWARPQNLPVVVLPGAGHFFHGKLTLLSDIVNLNVRD